MKRIVLQYIALALALASGASALADNRLQVRSAFVQEASKRGTAIVFVHGGGGSARETWKNPQSSKSWPEWMVGDDAFQEASVFVHDYASPYLERALNISQLAVEMHAILRDRGVLEYESIVFIAHSMGGLVVKSFLLTYREYLPRVRLVYFFGVPSKGTEVTRLARFLSRNPQPQQVTPAEADSYLARQIVDWRQLHAQRPLFPVHCAYEELPTRVIGDKVVDLSSAVEGCFEAPEPILADHIGMVKPLDRSSTPYVLFRDKFRKETRVAKPRPTNEQLSVRDAAANFLLKGTAAASQGNYLGAIEMFNEAIRIDPAWERAYYWRGQSYATVGQRERAVADLRRAIELGLADPDDRQHAQRLLGKIQLALNKRGSGEQVSMSTRPPAGNQRGETAPPRTRGVGATAPQASTGAEQELDRVVAQLFSNEDVARLRASALAVVEWGDDSTLVPRVVASARSHADDARGTLIALAVLQAVNPANVRAHRSLVSEFLSSAEQSGPLAADRAARLRKLVE
jgi:tetratricopeptide (TPR) repeat protein